MQSIQEDKYWYLSGDVKRTAIESDLKKQLRDLQSDTNKKLDNLSKKLEVESLYIAKITEESQKQSIKPGVKIPFKKKKVEVSKKALAAGACALFIAGGLTTAVTINIVKNVSTSVKESKIINQEMADFRTDHVIPNTQYGYATDPETKETDIVHWHDYTDIVMNAKQANEDPIVAFYLIYNSLDDYCKEVKMGTILDTYNRLYGTSYENVEDFLLKNNFAGQKEWKTYVANTISEQKEENLDGSSSFGRQ